MGPWSGFRSWRFHAGPAMTVPFSIRRCWRTGLAVIVSWGLAQASGEGIGRPRHLASKHADRSLTMLGLGWQQLSTTDHDRLTKRHPASLAVTGLGFRRITPCRGRRSAALSSGATPSTSTNFHRCFMVSKVFGRPSPSSPLVHDAPSKEQEPHRSRLGRSSPACRDGDWGDGHLP